MVTVWEMGIWPHSMCGVWCHLHQCFSPEERFLLCNRCLIEDTCQSGHVSCYHPLYATGRHYMCRNAATWRWSHFTKNIKNKKLLLGGFFVLFFVLFCFSLKGKKESIFFSPWVSGNIRDALLHAAWAGAGTHHLTASWHSSCFSPRIRLRPEDGFAPKCWPSSVWDISVCLWFCWKNQAEPFLVYNCPE